MVSKGESEASQEVKRLSSVLSPQKPKNNVFGLKNFIYGILVANVAKISTYAHGG